MNFKAYDILSSLIPGFLILLVLLNLFGFKYDKDYVIAYTAIAFLIGYVMNTLSSWLEDFYYFTCGGKPSNNLLDGKGIWKVIFYEHEKAKDSLFQESQKTNSTNDQLFSIAMRYTNGKKDSRVDDFYTNYAFSGVLLTTVLVITISQIALNYNDWRYYVTLIPMLIIIRLRCKLRGYYYAKKY